MKMTEAQKHLVALVDTLNAMKKHLSPFALDFVKEAYLRAYNYLEKVGIKK